MEWMIIGLLILSIVLFILSFFRKDKTAELERQMENFSITLMQEIYQLKKKIRILEEELLIEQNPTSRSRSSSTAALTEEVFQLYEAGYSIDEIAKSTGLNKPEVEQLLGHMNDSLNDLGTKERV
ncbi:hypothetical protein [Halalkalibacterium ligniniphilum]|uniref:hypothetical protein n=1 Tax=Halalkalibacterium ligniniphilum TaxID=1134413 RepID=UPI000346B1F4|nr:hypothetical protein [Halalkalibacterium ligniniphilum]